MADVAKESGLSRQTVYRFFGTRSELLAHISEQRMAAIAEKEAPFFKEFATVEEGIVEGSLIAIRLGRTDKLFQEIVNQAGEHAFDQFLFRGSDFVQNLMLRLWGPLLDRAREEGRLRPGVTNDDAVGWIRNVHAVLNMRDEDEATERKMLETFVVPSLLQGAPPEASAVKPAPKRSAKAQSPRQVA